MERKLSIVIVTWNSESFIEKCLETVLDDARRFDPETFLVDNASTDRTVKIVARAFPQITLIQNDRNLGFSVANNQAISRCSGAFVLLLNPDSCVTGGAIQKMMEFMELNPKIGVIGPKIINQDGSIQLTCARKLPSLSTEVWKLFELDEAFSQSRIFGRYLMSYWDHNDARYVELISGACMLIRSEVFKNCGMLDERFFLMYEDVEFCLRASKNDFNIYYLPEAVVMHFEGGSRTSSWQTFHQTTLNYYESMLRYYPLAKGPGYAFLVRTVMALCRLALLLRQLVRLLFNCANRARRHEAIAKLKMYYDITKLLLTPGASASNKARENTPKGQPAI